MNAKFSVLVGVLMIGVAACSTDATGPGGNDPPGTSREAAAAMGTPVQVQVNGSIWGNGVVRFTVLEIIRGKAANDLIMGWNQFNDDPDPGQEYLLAKFRVEVVSLENSNDPMDLNFLRFHAVSGSGVVHDPPFAVSGVEPELFADVYAGTHEGYVPLFVGITDGAPVVAFDREERHARWFRLY